MGCGASAQSEKTQELVADGQQTPIARGEGADCQIALRWNFIPGQPAEDLDVCAVALSGDGILADAAFYNNPRALGGAMKHFGDSRDGAADGDDEVMELDLDAIPMKGVCSVAVCVFAYKGSSLTHVDSITAYLRSRNKNGSWRQLARIPISGITGNAAIAVPVTGLLMAGLFSPDRGNSWIVKRMSVPLQGPKNHQEARENIREACFIADIIRSPPVGGPVMSEDRVFNMSKGDKATIRHDRITVGLGWEIKTGTPRIDLDASCILLGKAAPSGYPKVTDVVWHNDTQAPGIRHSGDNRTGDGDGDDECILIQFSKIDTKAKRLVITINSYNGFFSSVRRAWARVISSSGREMARYPLEAQSTQAVILCSFDRLSNNEWSFSALGLGCEGKTAKSGECMDAVCGRPARQIPDLTPGQSIFLPPTMYDDSDDMISILDEWGCRGDWIWLDATLLLFRKDGTRIGEIDFNDRAWPANKSERPVISHSGDMTDEAKTHGSHEIRIKMQRLTRAHPEVFSLLLVISAYSMDLTCAVKPFVSLRDNEACEIARFEPDTNFHATSIQMVDIHRHGEGWMLTAHGVLGEGKANEYGPIEKVYRHILPQLHDSTVAPAIDYKRLRQVCGLPAYRRGPPIT